MRLDIVIPGCAGYKKPEDNTRLDMNDVNEHVVYTLVIRTAEGGNAGDEARLDEIKQSLS